MTYSESKSEAGSNFAISSALDIDCRLWLKILV